MPDIPGIKCSCSDCTQIDHFRTPALPISPLLLIDITQQMHGRIKAAWPAANPQLQVLSEWWQSPLPWPGSQGSAAPDGPADSGVEPETALPGRAGSTLHS